MTTTILNDPNLKELVKDLQELVKTGVMNQKDAIEALKRAILASMKENAVVVPDWNQGES